MRLDNYLTEKGFFDSRTKAKQSIERGEIFINSKLINKASYEINVDLEYKIERICEDSFVSLGGFKLKKALTDFNFDCNNLIVADIGASTGGFTDCLLKNGAEKVYAIDLNDELLHKSLKGDNRVISIIKNAKDLTLKDFDDKIDLIVADLSFISLTMVIDTFSRILEVGKKMILLIKPQFETGEKKRFKNGIIRDEKVREQAVKSVSECAVLNGFSLENITTAPINKDKNVEYLILLQKIKNL